MSGRRKMTNPKKKWYRVSWQAEGWEEVQAYSGDEADEIVDELVHAGKDSGAVCINIVDVEELDDVEEGMEDE
jgi:hypothetical protein